MDESQPLTTVPAPSHKTKIFVVVYIILALIVGFLAGRVYDGKGIEAFRPKSTKPDDVDLSQFWRVWELIHENYVDKGAIDTDKLVYGAIQGMVNSLEDPYTVFFPPKESKAFLEQIQGAFGGVGMELGLRDKTLTVIAPIKNTPASRAGILAGDKIVKIGEQTTLGMSIDEAVSLIRGEKGTQVTLSIYRDTWSEPKDFTLTREQIIIPAAEWKMLEGNVAYLQIYAFNENVDQEFKKAAVEISASGAKKIILDLRNNPGGLLDSAVNIAGYFLDANKTVTIEKNADGTQKTYSTSKNALLKNYPLVILINKGSASASEILAGALHDNRNVSLIGETSFGKGLVQQIFDLDKGASVKITFAQWLTPNGTFINKHGIEPNIAVERTDADTQANKDPQLDKALEVIKGL